jgi:tetratricopeptide (TPR) repeat protein
MFGLVSGIRRDHEAYIAALRDWAAKGAESTWALEPYEVIERSTPRSADSARAAAHFELGEHLHRLGEVEAAQHHWREAHRLAPENWTYKRQAWQLVDPVRQGRTSVYEGSWVDDVTASGAENYYPPLRP